MTLSCAVAPALPIHHPLQLAVVAPPLSPLLRLAWILLAPTLALSLTTVVMSLVMVLALVPVLVLALALALALAPALALALPSLRHSPLTPSSPGSARTRELVPLTGFAAWWLQVAFTPVLSALKLLSEKEDRRMIHRLVSWYIVRDCGSLLL